MTTAPTETKRDQQQSQTTPGVKEQGKIAGASHANQGAWDSKEGKALAPPAEGHVSKSTTETDASKTATGNGAEVDGGP